MEAYRKSLVEAGASVLFLIALFYPQAGLVTVEEVSSFVQILIALATIGAPIFVWLVPNATNWRMGQGPNLSIYRKAIVSGVGAAMLLLSLYWPQVGIVTGAHVDAFVGVILTLIALFAPADVWRVPNAA